MNEGTVKFFNTTKGFGFITPADNSEDVFVHHTGLVHEIRENDQSCVRISTRKKRHQCCKCKGG